MRRKPKPATPAASARSHATEAELKLLEALWNAGPQNVRALAQQTGLKNPSAGQYATIQSLLDRLEKKGLVGRDRSQTPHIYHAAIERDAFVGRELESIANRVTGGALMPLLLTLVQRASLSDEDRRKLMELIDSPEQGGKERP